MALPNKRYSPFLGVDAGEPQGYESALDGAPLYHCVFPVNETSDAHTLADAVAEYQQMNRCPPSMCLMFRDRGIVCPDDFDRNAEQLIAEIKFVQHLPRQSGDIGLTQVAQQMHSFMGVRAMRSLTTREQVIIYDTDTRLSGRQIAEEARLHLAHLRETHQVDKLVLRFPNSGTVMVHRYMEDDRLLSLNTAIQRARKMKLLQEAGTVAA